MYQHLLRLPKLEVDDVESLHGKNADASRQADKGLGSGRERYLPDEDLKVTSGNASFRNYRRLRPELRLRRLPDGWAV